MRRKDREITDKTEIEAIVGEQSVCTLGLCRQNQPYTLPMNFGYEEGCFYFHSAKEGMKLDLIRDNSQASLTLFDMVSPIPGDCACEYSTEYRSVHCSGTIEILDTIEEKRKGLTILMNQQAGRKPWSFTDKEVSSVEVFKLTVTEITGKKKLG